MAIAVRGARAREMLADRAEINQSVPASVLFHRTAAIDTNWHASYGSAALAGLGEWGRHAPDGIDAMLFSSNLFLRLFLPLLLVLYYVSPQRARNLLLVAASLLFYAWGEVTLIVVMLASIGMNYGFALWVQQTRERRAGGVVLALAIAANLGLLLYFKYAVFLVESLNALLIGWHSAPLEVPDVRLPIGISFYTFQAMSYVVDVHRRHVDAERNPLLVALYIALFPQLIAGPIVRYVDIARQFRDRVHTLDGFAAGVRRFTVGLGKKVLIANSVASVADSIFEIPAGELTAGVAWLGIACYTLQIYFDFSGYSDMAIGLGRMFGFTFNENFNYPYIAISIQDFWRRWHISLSTWFRDYLYIPLGGSRCAPWRVSVNLLVVFLLCGLWHGASWTFAAWGLYHGVFLMLERLGLASLLEKGVPRPLRHAYVLLVVMGGWVLFRANSFGHALSYFQSLAGFGPAASAEFHLGLYAEPAVLVALALGAIASLPMVPWLWDQWERGGAALGLSGGLRNVLAFGQVAAVAMILLASSALLTAGTYNPFLYFRF